MRATAQSLPLADGERGKVTQLRRNSKGPRITGQFVCRTDLQSVQALLDGLQIRPTTILALTHKRLISRRAIARSLPVRKTPAGRGHRKPWRYGGCGPRRVARTRGDRYHQG